MEKVNVVILAEEVQYRVKVKNKIYANARILNKCFFRV